MSRDERPLLLTSPAAPAAASWASSHSLAARTIKTWCNAHLSSQDAGVLVDQAGKRWRSLLLIRSMAQHHRALHEILHRHSSIAKSASGLAKGFCRSSGELAESIWP